jgi:hypothetical protein
MTISVSSPSVNDGTRLHLRNRTSSGKGVLQRSERTRKTGSRRKHDEEDIKWLDRIKIRGIERVKTAKG